MSLYPRMDTMKIFEIQLLNAKSEIVYKSLVPECHVKEKIDTLVGMNKIADVGGILIKEMGDISDRYIQRYVHEPSRSSKLAK